MSVAPFGSWASPITSDLITQSSIRLGNVVIDGPDVYWLESRPKEAGRTVVVRRDASGVSNDVTPESFNVRTLAHEYGGGAYTVVNGIVYFVNYKDQRVYRQKIGGTPEPLTAEKKCHYADFCVDEQRNRLICVEEDHSAEGEEALTTLIAISLKDGTSEMLIAGNDFYATPRLSPNGMFMSWMSWNHPNMPWDESVVWAANVGSDGLPSNMRKIAGGVDESVFLPQWSPGGELFYISDRNGWWNIYRHTDYEGEQIIADMPAEFGAPQWVFGQSTYCFSSENNVIATYSQRGFGHLSSINVENPENSELTEFVLPFTDYQYLQANSTHVYFLAASPTASQALIQLDLKSGATAVLKHSSESQIESGFISAPEAIEFQTTGGKTAHAFFYAPKNKNFQGPNGELPPLLVKSHGGPTSATTGTLSLHIQYWTSRGFAVVDVNYGGSTGYGREYRNRLYDSWGIVDVDDCINAAKYLAQSGKVDEQRLCITGGSAGGYTTLCALTFHDVFKAGGSSYGIGDLEALAQETHKFESRYLDRLVGPYPASAHMYKQRSPINFADKLTCPAIFLQGLEDKVVPPNQSKMMVDALRKNGVPVAYVTFAEEQHGFRQAANIKRALDAEFYFYSQIFGFQPADKIEPVSIENHKPLIAK